MKKNTINCSIVCLLRLAPAGTLINTSYPVFHSHGLPLLQQSLLTIALYMDSYISNACHAWAHTCTYMGAHKHGVVCACCWKWQQANLAGCHCQYFPKSNCLIFSFFVIIYFWTYFYIWNMLHLTSINTLNVWNTIKQSGLVSCPSLLSRIYIVAKW